MDTFEQNSNYIIYIVLTLCVLIIVMMGLWIYRFMDLFQEFGFSDSEPSQTATDIINNYYKTNIDRWESFKAGWAAS